MSLHIDNSQYAQSNILFGRVLPAAAILCAAWTLWTTLSSGLTNATIVPAMLTALWIVVMVVVYIRRGQHPAIVSIDFLPDHLEVQFVGRTATFDAKQISAIEYEGIHNPSRAKVVNAPFPKDGERILVITLADVRQLRVRVAYEHDAPLKEFAASVAAQ